MRATSFERRRRAWSSIENCTHGFNREKTENRREVDARVFSVASPRIPSCSRPRHRARRGREFRFISRKFGEHLGTMLTPDAAEEKRSIAGKLARSRELLEFDIRSFHGFAKVHRKFCSCYRCHDRSRSSNNSREAAGNVGRRRETKTKSYNDGMSRVTRCTYRFYTQVRSRGKNVTRELCR